MIAVISGTNRPDANSRHLARLCLDHLEQAGADGHLLDLVDLPPTVFSPQVYAAKPPELAPWQQAVLDADGLLFVVPEYNGSFPGILKYFIDLLEFPASLYEKPCAFIGLAAGRFAGLRAVEQLEMVCQYRHAHLYGRRCFFSGIHQQLDGDGRLADPAMATRLEETVSGFVAFCRRLTAG